MYEISNLAADIKWRRLGWLGSVMRIEKTKVAKTIFESELGSTRKARTLKLKLLEDVKNDLRERKMKRWRQRTSNIGFI
jgi:hypothetical protein